MEFSWRGLESWTLNQLPSLKVAVRTKAKARNIRPASQLFKARLFLEDWGHLSPSVQDLGGPAQCQLPLTAWLLGSCPWPPGQVKKTLTCLVRSQQGRGLVFGLLRMLTRLPFSPTNPPKECGKSQGRVRAEAPAREGSERKLPSFSVQLEHYTSFENGAYIFVQFLPMKCDVRQ